MKCLICFDDDNLEPFLESKICLCKGAHYHESCLTEWVRTTDIPRCPTCSSILNVECANSAPLKLDYIKTAKAVYRSGVLVYVLSFIISVLCILAVLITRHLLVVIFSIAFFVAGFFLNCVMRLSYPNTSTVAYSVDAFIFISIVGVVFFILPKEVSDNLISIPMILVCLIGVGILWWMIYRDINGAIQKMKNKRNKMFRTLKIPKE